MRLERNVMMEIKWIVMDAQNVQLIGILNVMEVPHQQLMFAFL